MKIFITGVSSGIGKSLVKILVSEGHEVWGIARREELLKTLSSDLDNPLFRYERCDICDAGEVEAVHRKMEQEGYLPDVFILNAAVDLEDEYPDLSAETTAKMMRTNLDGSLVWVSRFIIPCLERGSGQFIAISSLFAHWPDAAAPGYSASKAALSMFFRGLRARYQNSGVAFKLMYLGPVSTSINPRFEELPDQKSFIISSAEETAAAIYKSIAIRRQNFYFPFYVFIALGFFRWLPDSLFELLTSRFRR